MATVSKVLARTAAATTSTTLYTTPSATTTVVTNVVVTNAATTTQTFSILLDDVALVSSATLQPNGIVAFDIKQVLAATDTIKGSASTTSVNFHISGVEIG